MYSKWEMLRKYLSYYLNGSNSKGHGMHSPFVFQLITQVMNDRTIYPEYKRVEALRLELVRNKTILSIDDLGAGSVVAKTNQRSISSIAKNAAKPPRLAQLLFRIVRHYQPQNIIELGTSLGLTTAYLALANTKAKVTTLEGASTVAATAKQNFETLGIGNINLVQGNFDDTLPALIHRMDKIDLAFIDGNHRREPTERYFQQLLPCMQNDSILIFDDIHWSAEMEAAWDTICKHSSVRCTVDLFFIGIVFFRQEFHEKRNFTVKF